MSKIGEPKGLNGPSNLSKWDTSFSSVFTTESRSLTGNWTVLTPTSRLMVVKQKPMSGSSRIQSDGWRNPTVFQAYVINHRPGPAFQYTGKVSAFDREHRGSRGYIPNDAFFWIGTAGAGRFPRTSLNTENRALTECLNKLKDGVANLGESLATFNQTLGLIADVLTKMRAVFTAINAKNIADAKMWDRARTAYYSAIRSKKSRKSIRKRVFFKSWGVPVKRPSANWYSAKAGSYWLELQYGWKPLVNDIVALVGSLKSGIPSLRLNAVRDIKEHHSLPQGTFSSLSNGSLKTTGSLYSGCRVRADVSVKSPALAQLDSLGLVNPYSLAWELLPFSFVIDWFIPIGNCLKAISAGVGFDLKGISVTRYTVGSVTAEWVSFAPYQKGTKISGTIDTLAVYRTAMLAWPGPAPYMKSPFTSMTRLASAFSVLTQLR